MNFHFAPAWKERLYVSGYGQTFILDDLPHTTKVTYLPTKTAWKTKAPKGLEDKWDELRQEMEEWCKTNDRKLVMTDTAPLHQEHLRKSKIVSGTRTKTGFWDWLTSRD